MNSSIEISWTIPAAVLVTIVGVLYLPFLARLERTTRNAFVLSGAIYLGGAVVVEYLTEPFADQDLLDTLAYNFTTALEEGMEMGGIVLFIYALLRHMRDVAGLEGVVLKTGASEA